MLKLILMFALAVLLAAPSCAAVLEYRFTVNPEMSGLDAVLTYSVLNEGTLIGNYDAALNPDGTRTKPGLLSSFGATENVPVPVKIRLSAAEHTDPGSSGSFTFAIGPGSDSIKMSGYQVQHLSRGPMSLPVSAEMVWDAFRTRNPSSTYPGGIPVEVPLGDVIISDLSVVQMAPTTGLLTQIGPGRYQYSVLPMVVVTARASVFGVDVEIDGEPAAMLLEGELLIDGEWATAISSQPIGFVVVREPDFALPRFYYDLPTILPPGEIAHLAFDLTVKRTEMELAGEVVMSADGVLVPEPSSVLALAAVLGLCRLSAFRRRS